VTAAPSVTLNPTNLTVCSGSAASFSAAASGSPAPTVQWQANSGGGFTNVPGATASPLGFTAGTLQSGNQFRAVFSNTSGTATSAVATLTVNTPTAVTTDPVSTNVCAGALVSFTSAASGSPALQWQANS